MLSRHGPSGGCPRMSKARPKDGRGDALPLSSRRASSPPKRKQSTTTIDSYFNTVDQISREIIQSFDKQALAFARAQAEIVAELNDPISAQAWRDIADAIDRIQSQQRSKNAA